MNWQHLRTILWLRSRVSRNQWRRQGKVAGFLRTLFLIVGTVAMLGGGIGGFLLGAVALDGKPFWIGWLVLGGLAAVFLFIWLIGIVAEIQRSEAIDIRRLLHLPISLGQVFVLNYLASLLTPTFLLLLPSMLGLSAGLTVSQGFRSLWAFPLLLAFLFTVTAWTYYLRGWLVSLMVNKRRRRTIIMALTVGIILVSQLPNLTINNYYVRDYLRQTERIKRLERHLRQKREAQARQRNAEAGQIDPAVVGPDSLSVSTATSTGIGLVPWWGALLVSLSGLAVGALGLQRAYVLTLRFYRGQETPRRARPVESRAPPDRRVRFLEWRLPGCSDELSAMSLTFLQSALRAPETKMALVMPLIMVVVFGSIHFGRGGDRIPEAFRPLVLLGVVGMALLSATQLSANLFGADRQGFRALVVLPVARWKILLSKNLALLPLPTIIAIALSGLLALLWRLSFSYLLAAGLQMLAGYCLLSIVGNYLSVRVPYRIAPGSLKPTKTSPLTSLLMLVLYLLFPLVLLPLAFPFGIASLVAFLTAVSFSTAHLAASLLLLVAAAIAYRFSLPTAGRYLQSREKDILQTVTSEVE